jgi:hypothetical protein
MRIDIILAERSRVRAELVSLEKGLRACSATTATEAIKSDEKLLAQHQRLTERLSFIDATVQQLQHKPG